MTLRTLATLAVCLGGTLLHAVPPKLEAVFPAGGQAGSSFVMTATGRVEPDAKLWTDAPGVYLVPNGKKREWQVTITADAPRGLHLIQCANAEGASTEPRWFSVGSLPETTEAEPNDEVGKPQSVDKLPVCMNARLDKAGDVDGYAVKLEAGQTLVVAVEAYALGSGVDMLAHVLDENGVRLHTGSDSRNLDPVLNFKAPKAGRYIVQVAGFSHPPSADVRFTGSAAMVYRLHLSASAVVTQVFPQTVTLSGKSEVELIGHNLDPKKTKHAFESKDIRREGDLALVTPPGAVWPIQVFVSEKAATIEKEPNNTKEQPTPIQVGAAAGGRIADKADVDRFAVTMRKGDKLQARVLAKRLGLPLDALLKIEGPDGKLIISSDGESEQRPDPQVVWTAAADGAHVIVVEDLFHRGGDDKSYVLAVTTPVSEVEVSLPDAKPLVIEAGKAVSVKASVKPVKGSKDAYVLRISNLPTGVFADAIEVPEKGGEVELKLQAATNALPANQPLRIELWTKASPFTIKPATGPLRGESKRGTSLLDETSQVWLTVK
ncbi:MAG: PPC domain-containing protein [Verrucomicrobiota bacterium]